MTMHAVDVREAAPGDLTAIAEIYGHYVRHSVATFEEVPPDVAEMTRRYEAIHERGFPYLVAEGEGRVLGYSYAGPYRTRPAYRYTVEDTIYLHPDAVGRGLGRLLLGTLIARCEALDLRQMVAIVGGRVETAASIALHGRMGFADLGALEGVGYKFGRWIETTFMQRALGAGTTAPPRSAQEGRQASGRGGGA
jgi:phosphinothricin acetyltransferase